MLATNVIELRLKYAKVAPLPSTQPSAAAAPPGPAAQLPPGQPPRQPPGQQGQPPGQPSPGTRGAQALEPLPPGPLDPDPRQPSAGPRHGGS